MPTMSRPKPIASFVQFYCMSVGFFIPCLANLFDSSNGSHGEFMGCGSEADESSETVEVLMSYVPPIMGAGASDMRLRLEDTSVRVFNLCRVYVAVSGSILGAPSRGENEPEKHQGV